MNKAIAINSKPKDFVANMFGKTRFIVFKSGF